MPLESCMILLDNSEYMRNGDYIPTRLEAQQDAANLLVGAKTQSHPESTVGVSAGTELLVSPTEDVGKILGALHNLPLRSGAGPEDVAASVQVASLALKHRRNKNGGQRIVLFVGSPLGSMDSRTLVKAGRQLRKNNVAIDVVAMGELEENEDRLRDLVEAANGRSDEGNRTCHLVTIPPGVLPSDVLASSPIVHGEGGVSGLGGDVGGGGGDAGFGAFADFGGVDPNMDPELAMALRISMEEERARQERAAAAAASAAQGGDADAVMADPSSSGATGSGLAMDLGLSEEEALLQQALAMSMNENDPPTDDVAVAPMDADGDDDSILMALQLSMQPEDKDEEQQQFQDPQFVNQLLGSLPGVDPNDPQIQNALRDISKDAEKDQGKDRDESKEE